MLHIQGMMANNKIHKTQLGIQATESDQDIETILVDDSQLPKDLSGQKEMETNFIS